MIKKLIKYVGEYKKPTILTPIFVLLESVMEILIPLLMAKLIDDGIDMGDMNVIVKYGLILLAAALLTMFFGSAAGVTAANASAGFAKNVRRGMYYKIQEFSFGNIDKFSTASLVTRLTTDVSNVQQVFQMMTRICFRAPAILVFALIAAFSVNKEL